jgi:murein DD-endopeptidase MepM/ murein hydrolase activator NlpD
MKNRYYTIMIVPEKTAQVRKIIVPAWLLRGTAVGLAFVFLMSIVMLSDYWQVMSQIDQNKNLKMENRRLKQQVQVFQNKLTTAESTLERIKTFATRLKVITNIEGRQFQTLNEKLPDASTNIGTAQNSGPAAPATGEQPSAGLMLTSGSSSDSGTNSASNSLSPTAASVSEARDPRDPDDILLRREYEELDFRFVTLNQSAFEIEQMLQDQYELLADQKSFLAALPTRKPTVGYFTSGFGVRKSPINDRVKMHEGLDIANYPGTPIKATADGVVLFASTKAGYGQTVIVDHGYGLETWYAHTRKVLVSKGQKVERGETVALLGNSGRSTGPHLHYEVRVNGTPVDPLSYILED